MTKGTTDRRMFRWSGPLMVILALSSAACTRQPGGMANQQSGTSGQPSTGMEMQGHGMPGMGGMQDHNMGGMDMQATMNHCAQMRQDMRQGAVMNPEMPGMMAQCNQMDGQMGGTSSSGSAPSTRDPIDRR